MRENWAPAYHDESVLFCLCILNRLRESWLLISCFHACNFFYYITILFFSRLSWHWRPGALCRREILATYHVATAYIIVESLILLESKRIWSNVRIEYFNSCNHRAFTIPVLSIDSFSRSIKKD